MAEPSFSRSLEIKSNRFRWILMRTTILIFLRQEEQEHFFLLSSKIYRWGKLIFSTEKWILVQPLAYQGGVINVLCQRRGCRGVVVLLFLLICLVFIIVPLSLTIVPRVEFGLNIDETWRILFARFFLLSTCRTWH